MTIVFGREVGCIVLLIFVSTGPVVMACVGWTELVAMEVVYKSAEQGTASWWFSCRIRIRSEFGP